MSLQLDSDYGLEIDQAFFVKLGRGGEWEQDSIDRGLLRIGWPSVPLSEINSGNWDSVTRRAESATTGAATRDTNALKFIALSDSKTIWITFHGSRMWWCQLAAGAVEMDELSKFRRAKGEWSDSDARGAPLLTNALPGVLTQIQGFRGTVCRVKDRTMLGRVLSGQPSLEAEAIEDKRSALAEVVEQGIKQLHWKDFELLVDLLFRQSGWQRLTAVGETMKFTDLDLVDPLTGDRYQVQVKSAADSGELAKYADAFDGAYFRKLYFVVHSPVGSLSLESGQTNVEVVPPSRLARMVIDLGLIAWLLAKLR